MLTITHSYGFFSCCSVRLDNIINFFNIHKILPKIVDSTAQFSVYKPPTKNSKDITFEYFEHYDNIKEHIYSKNADDTNKNKNNLPIDYNHEKQFTNYKLLNYDDICPFVKKYFSPSNKIQNIIKTLEDKYKIDNYGDICVLFYRGNDKITETQLASYNDIIKRGQKILSTNPNIKFLIQSDETEFIKLATKTFATNSFYFKDEIRHMKKQNNTVDVVFKEKNYKYSKYYLAITIIMSKCNYIVCGSSGNCSIWIMLYRGHTNNVYQYLPHDPSVPSNPSPNEWIS